MSLYKKIFTSGDLFICIFIFFYCSSCTGSHVRTDIDTANSGLIHISVDESFKPVIDSEIQVFEALYPKAKIIADYKPEAECFKDLIKDSTRMIIVTRGLTDEEAKFYKDSIKYEPSWDKIANDAIALVVNNKSADTALTLQKIRGILNGTTGDKEIAVFDGLSGTSTARYVIDSILRGKPFDPKKVFAAKSSQEVINYVSSNNNVIGFVGVSWIGNKEDTSQLSFLKKVKIVAIECSCPEKTFVKPYQYNIMAKRYPLVRGLYYILKENYDGLGSGFSNFLIYEKGQLIFKRAYLGPTKMNFSVRTATMN
ncbi:MAG: substrate-binding domain-containing protein [Bacteroidota bacterium]|nr:substrate-binding domain-containing protein [Bacteroidota bacterium]